jgi:hypothetical protein
MSRTMSDSLRLKGIAISMFLSSMTPASLAHGQHPNHTHNGIKGASTGIVKNAEAEKPSSPSIFSPIPDNSRQPSKSAKQAKSPIIDESRRQPRDPLLVCRDATSGFGVCSQVHLRSDKFACLRANVALVGKNCAAALTTYLRKKIRKNCSNEAAMWCPSTSSDTLSTCLAAEVQDLSVICRSSLVEAGAISENGDR